MLAKTKLLFIYREKDRAKRDEKLESYVSGLDIAKATDMTDKSQPASSSIGNCSVQHQPPDKEDVTSRYLTRRIVSTVTIIYIEFLYISSIATSTTKMRNFNCNFSFSSTYKLNTAAIVIYIANMLAG